MNCTSNEDIIKELKREPILNKIYWHIRSAEFNVTTGCKKPDFYNIANHMDQEADGEDIWREHWTNGAGARKEMIC
jgi:hypothetical protein